ncbi:hypothetical protein NXW67_22635 [Bacteroides fragilis]|nr:hypothetical protein [Bacteroides fragilis]
MEARLTIKAVIRWEQLRGKSFSLMDYSDKEDVNALLYTSTIVAKGEVYTFDVFKKTLSNRKLVREMVLSLENRMSVLAQFQNKRAGTDKINSDTTPGMIGNIVSTLIMSGLDATYALEEMELCDLPMYIEAYERKRKEEMEASRLWTFFTMLPHIDSKKMKNGAMDLITFPWEEVEATREAERAINEDIDRFEQFMKEGKKLINK